MHLLQAGVGAEVIALWLGHESPNTTHHYVEADLQMKCAALKILASPKIKRITTKHTDPLTQALDNL